MERELPEVFAWGGFTVHNGGLSDEDMEKVLSDYSGLVRRINSKGFGKILYGPLLIVGQELPGHVFDHRTNKTRDIKAAAMYYTSKDLVVLNNKYVSDPLVLAHELGHRQWFRFLTQAQRDQWRENFFDKRSVLFDTRRQKMLNRILEMCAPSDSLKESDIADELLEKFRSRGRSVFRPYVRWDKFNYKKFESSVKNLEEKYQLWTALLAVTGEKDEEGVRWFVKDKVKTLSKNSLYLVEIHKGLKEFPNKDDQDRIDMAGPEGAKEERERRIKLRASRWENVISSVYMDQYIFFFGENTLGKEISPSLYPSISTTEYGKSNDEEDYAEAFAAIVNNRPMPEEVYELFMRVHGLRKASMKSSKIASEILSIAKLVMKKPLQSELNL